MNLLKAFEAVMFQVLCKMLDFLDFGNSEFCSKKKKKNENEAVLFSNSETTEKFVFITAD